MLGVLWEFQPSTSAVSCERGRLPIGSPRWNTFLRPNTSKLRRQWRCGLVTWKWWDNPWYEIKLNDMVGYILNRITKNCWDISEWVHYSMTELFRSVMLLFVEVFNVVFLGRWHGILPSLWDQITDFRLQVSCQKINPLIRLRHRLDDFDRDQTVKHASSRSSMYRFVSHWNFHLVQGFSS